MNEGRDDARAAEVELLQAMYCGQDEFVHAAAGEGTALGEKEEIAFELRVLPGPPAPVCLFVSLPPGYPMEPATLRVACEGLRREDIDALYRELDALEFAEGESQVLAAADWLREHAPARFQAANAENHLPPRLGGIRSEGGEQDDDGEATEQLGGRRSLGTAMRRGKRCKLWEERGDLFEVGPEWALCHCVSKDLDMGAGIAVEFKKRFGGVQELRGQGVDVGGVGVLEKKGRYVYYLVTKNRHGGKPTYERLRASLCAMRDHVVAEKVRNLAMPHLGCGLDRLSWERVSALILEVFDDVELELLARAI